MTLVSMETVRPVMILLPVMFPVFYWESSSDPSMSWKSTRQQYYTSRTVNLCKVHIIIRGRVVFCITAFIQWHPNLTSCDLHVLPLAPEILESWCVSDMQILYSLVYKENRNSGLKQDSCFSCLRYFGNGLCLFSLASDPPAWWKTWNLLCRQEFDHIQKVWVFVSGPHCLDNLYLTQVWHNGYRQRS